jgi:predicted DNA-binding protein
MTKPYSDADRYTDFDPANLVVTGEEVPAEQLPVPDDDQVWVTTSFRMRRDQHERVTAFAKAHGLDKSTLLRQWVDMQLAAEGEAAAEPISRGDALRALAGLPPLPRSA